MEEDIVDLDKVEFEPNDDEKYPVVVSKDQLVPKEVRPDMSEDIWFDYVMKQFTEDELEQGYPKVDGLRRVVRKLLGPIVESSAHCVQAPNEENGFTATVEHKIVIHWLHNEDYLPAHERTFTEISDVSMLNTSPEFYIHASATASSKAEGRALRKALMLKIIAAEEISQQVTANTGDKINDNQKNFITLFCKRLKIDLFAFINNGKLKYEKIEDVGHGTAALMIQQIGYYQRNKNKIPDSIKVKNEVQV